MYEFPKPMSYESVRALRDELIRDAREQDNAPAMVDYYLTEFVHRFEDAMSQSQTVFYQP